MIEEMDVFKIWIKDLENIEKEVLGDNAIGGITIANIREKNAEFFIIEWNGYQSKYLLDWFGSLRLDFDAVGQMMRNHKSSLVEFREQFLSYARRNNL